jgi:Cu-Zn family superoxide dismutase
MKTLSGSLVFLLLAALPLRGQSPSPAAATQATATLKNAQGASLGTVTLRDTPNGVLLKGDLTGAPPGAHAFHIHTTGLCEAPMFTSAGGHFAPGGTKHGLLTVMGPHAGDLPNIYVPDDGKLSFEVLAKDVTLAPGPRSLFDADGSAVMLHAMGDDYMTDPAGNAGGRIACGVVTR